MSTTRKNDQRAQKRAARQLAAETGVSYQEALRRVRAQNATYAVTVLSDGAANTTTVTGLQAARDLAREQIEASSGDGLDRLRPFLDQAETLDVDGGEIRYLPNLSIIRVALADRLVQIDPDLRGWFKEGYTDDMIDSVAPQVSQQLGLRVVCVWGHRDEWGCGGDSEIVVLTDQGSILPPPDGLIAFLDGEGDGLIDPRTTGTEPYPHINPADLADTQIGAGHNLVYEDNSATDDEDDEDGPRCRRCEGTGIDPAAPANRCEKCGGTGKPLVDVDAVCDAIDALPAERMGDIWSRYTLVMTDIRDVGRPKYSDPDDWNALLAELTSADQQ